MGPLFVGPDMRMGGAERQWATLICALAERGHRPALLTLAGEGPLFAEVAGAGVATLCAGLKGRADPAGLRRALRFARGRTSVVVSRAVSAELVGQVLARREGVRHVVNEHTPCTLDGGLLALRAHQQLLRRLLAPRVDGVVAVAQAQLKPLAASGFRREHMRVVANGVALGPRRGRRPPAASRSCRRGCGPKSAWTCSWRPWPACRGCAAWWPARAANVSASSARSPRGALLWSCWASATTWTS